MSAISSKRAVDLLLELKRVIEEQESTIAEQALKIHSLQSEVLELTASKEALLEKIQQLEQHPTPNVSQKKQHRRRSSSVSGVSVSRSSSFQKKHLEEGDSLPSSNSYELSSDIRDKQVEVLRKLYGGAQKSEHAARVIQEAYRKYRMRVNFRKIRHSKVRRLTVESVPHPKHFMRDYKPSSPSPEKVSDTAITTSECTNTDKQED
uniref:Uncharacterized protein n=1 Tax=Ciona savignyi TaxID=51511 RepID=H2ZJI8_CIOSA